MLQDNLTEYPDQRTTTGYQIVLLTALVAIGVIGLISLGHNGNHDRERVSHVEPRMPVANRPVDPNRPDLFEEPAIDE